MHAYLNKRQLKWLIHNKGTVRFRTKGNIIKIIVKAHSEIAPLFKDAPSNCYFDMKWRPWLPETAKYWGTI